MGECTHCGAVGKLRRGLCIRDYGRLRRGTLHNEGKRRPAIRPCRHCGQTRRIRGQEMCSSCYMKSRRGTLGGRRRSNRTCTWGDCREPHSARDLCKRHHAQYLRGRLGEPPKDRPVCIHCTELAKARGVCVRHYSELRRRERGVPERRWQVGECEMEGCSAPKHVHGLCNRHDLQARRAEKARTGRRVPVSCERCGAANAFRRIKLCQSCYTKEYNARRRGVRPAPQQPRPLWGQYEEVENVRVVHWPPRGEGDWTCPDCGRVFVRPAVPAAAA